MKKERINPQLGHLDALSDRLFGAAGDVEPAEAESLLGTAGVDPARLKAGLYQRMLERSKEYITSGRPLPPLLRQALADLRPSPHRDENKNAEVPHVRQAIVCLLKEIRALPELLDDGFKPSFMAAYRNRSELSDRDKQLLDQLAEELRRKHKPEHSRE